MTTLYRQYRPQKFSEVRDQETVIKTITNEISTSKIAQAYLFTGPRGVGKTTIARLMSKAINCKNRAQGNFEPCDQCSSCLEISKSNNIDVIEIDAASHTGVDNVRENIIENAQFKPTVSSYKIFIIDEVHMLSNSAFNALLKTIEEPPAHVIFILATTEIQKLPATIISRCQRFTFKKIDPEMMMEKLKNICKKEEVKVDEEVLERIIAKSEGGMRDAESLLGQILSSSSKEISIGDVEALLPNADFKNSLLYIESIIKKNASQALSVLKTIVEAGNNLDEFAQNCLQILRSIIISASGFENKNIINADKEILKQIAKLSKETDLQTLLSMTDALIKRKKEIKYSPITELPLELFAIEFTQTNQTTKTVSTEDQKTEKIIKKEPSNDSEKSSQPDKKDIEIEIKSPETVKEEPSTLPIQTTLDDIKKHWNDIVVNIAKTAPALVFILKNSSLKNLDSRGLEIALSFKIHQEKLDEAKNRKSIEDELEKHFKERIKVRSIIEERPDDSKDLGDLAMQFGGEVI